MDALDYWSKLELLSDGEPPAVPLMAAQKRTVSGLRIKTVFIATEDHDGHVEISLSIKGLKRPTDGHVIAFFRWLGVNPISEDLSAQRWTRHFIMPPVASAVVKQ